MPFTDLILVFFGLFLFDAFLVALVVVVAFVVVVVFALLNDLLNSFAIEYAPSTILLSAVIWLAVVEVVNCEETLESVVVLDGIVIFVGTVTLIDEVVVAFGFLKYA